MSPYSMSALHASADSIGMTGRPEHVWCMVMPVASGAVGATDDATDDDDDDNTDGLDAVNGTVSVEVECVRDRVAPLAAAVLLVDMADCVADGSCTPTADAVMVDAALAAGCSAGGPGGAKLIVGGSIPCT